MSVQKQLRNILRIKEENDTEDSRPHSPVPERGRWIHPSVLNGWLSDCFRVEPKPDP